MNIYLSEDVESIPNLDHMRDYLTGVMEAMYITGDVAMMESCIDELCCQLGLKIHPGDPVIERKK